MFVVCLNYFPLQIYSRNKLSSRQYILQLELMSYFMPSLLKYGMTKYLKTMVFNGRFLLCSNYSSYFLYHLNYLNPNHNHPQSSVVPMEETLSDNKQE